MNHVSLIAYKCVHHFGEIQIEKAEQCLDCSALRIN